MDSQASASPQPSGPSLEEFYATLPLPDAQSIRLLYLHASTQEIVTGRLRVVSLASSPRFDALSYVWACHSNMEECRGRGCCERSGACVIQCGLARVPITKNGYFALRSLTKQLGHITIWINSVCINQDDIDERNHQVGLMRQIYSFARTTYIWLDDALAASDRDSGTATPSDPAFNNLNAALRYVRHDASILRTFISSHPDGLKFWSHTHQTQPLHEARNAVMRTYKGWLPLQLIMTHFHLTIGATRKSYSSSIDNSPLIPRLRPNTKIPGFEDAFWTDLESILIRPWFQRAWTFQEFILSHHPVMVCENTMLDCDLFFKTILVPNDSEEELQLVRGYSAWKDLLSLWFNIDRPTEWNGNKIRKEIFKTRQTSFAAYMQKLYRPVFKNRWCYAIIVVIEDFFFVGASTAIFIFSVSLSLWLLLGFVFLLSILLLQPSPFSNGSDEGASFRLLPATSLMNGVIRSLRHRKSTNARDSVYSLYGILSAIMFKSNPLLVTNSTTALSEPDYKKSPSTVYFELLSDLLRWQADYVCLLMDAGKGLLPHQGGPSWVPDWSSQGLRTWLDEGYLYGENPSVTSGAPVVAHVHRFELCVEGIVMGSCQSFTVTPCQNNAEQSNTCLEDSTLQSLLRWLKAVQLEASFQPINHHLELPVYQALVGKIQYPTDAQGRAFHKWFRIMMSEAVKLEESQSLERLKEEIETDSAISAWHSSCIAAIRGRRSLFVDSEGHLGSGPPYMIEGDEVALIAGLPLPAILRCKEHVDEGVIRYYFVGPAFVAGMMKREEWSSDKTFAEIRLA
ncbi:heterokaryon incompatibility protein-domain-containing protein [Xylaria arbuscula]|nr:heterokaryon incompatibility protein-domain-containing protein [Xylaria arbuscula]